MVSFANEMNGQWFPWSGMFYGGDKPVPGASPVPYISSPQDRFPPAVGPAVFKAAYRHVVDRVRARGASQRDLGLPFHELLHAGGGLE